MRQFLRIILLIIICNILPVLEHSLQAAPNWFARRKPASVVFQSVVKGGKWRFVDATPLNFDTYHPQGLVKIDNEFYLSSVETKEKPSKFLISHAGEDRTAGRGHAYLFHFDEKGQLLRKKDFQYQSLYHPGGIDTDKKRVWIPVSEYRPNSISIVYEARVKDLRIREAFRFADHIGALAYEPRKKKLHVVSWAARTFSPVDLKGYRLGPPVNRNDEIKIQDCHFAGPHAMLCAGISDPFNPLTAFFRHGRIILYDLSTYRILDQIEAPWDKKRNILMTRNAMSFEVVEGRLRFYFVPEDRKSHLYIYELE